LSRYVEIQDGDCRVIVFDGNTKSVIDKCYDSEDKGADVAPVVRGEWIEAKSGVMSLWPPGQVMCSVCKQRMPSQWKKMPPYCYGCGAKMDGGTP
jgi:hypothetical protein